MKAINAMAAVEAARAGAKELSVYGSSVKLKVSGSKKSPTFTRLYPSDSKPMSKDEFMRAHGNHLFEPVSAADATTSSKPE